MVTYIEQGEVDVEKPVISFTTTGGQYTQVQIGQTYNHPAGRRQRQPAASTSRFKGGLGFRGNTSLAPPLEKLCKNKLDYG